MSDIQDFREFVLRDLFDVTEHAAQEAANDGFSAEEVSERILTGEITAQQYDDMGSKWLVDGQTYLTRRRIRVIVRLKQLDDGTERLVAVTVHELRTRRRQ